MKPYNSEIIKAMAEHSDECAAYASAMVWDYKRRLTVAEAKKVSSENNCPFCVRFILGSTRPKEQCPLNKIFGDCCHYDKKDNLWQKVNRAMNAEDQQAFAEAANNLYFQIRSIIDDFYKAKAEKEEVFYHRGQKFSGPFDDEYILAAVGEGHEVMMINANDGCYCGNSRMKVKSATKITEAELEKICARSGGFTLIEDKKK